MYNIQASFGGRVPNEVVNCFMPWLSLSFHSAVVLIASFFFLFRAPESHSIDMTEWISMKVLYLYEFGSSELLMWLLRLRKMWKFSLVDCVDTGQLAKWEYLAEIAHGDRMTSDIESARAMTDSTEACKVFNHLCVRHYSEVFSALLLASDFTCTS